MSKFDTDELVELNVTGMHCNNCAISVHKLLEKKGLTDVYVDFANEEVKFRLQTRDTVQEVIKDIEGLGYKVLLTAEHGHEHFYEKVENKFLFCLVFTLPLFLHMLLPFHWLHHPYVQLMLCLPVFITGTLHFGRSAFYSVIKGIPNMDVLIFVGSGAAFVYSVIGTVYNLGENYLFYETAATIITLVLLGNVLEKRSVKQTTSAVRDLLKFQQTSAIRIKNGETEHINAAEILPGDTLLVNSGDKTPTDGEIIWGEASVNESMITGESIPVEKGKYDLVIGGTIVEKGSIHMLVTKVGKQTVLSQIIELMKKAQGSKPMIQKLGDRVAAVFVPIVIGISILTFFTAHFVFDVSTQKALMNAIAVLVISCPCAMGLATPTAVMVGLGRAAKSGILVKGGNTLEELSSLKYIVFDKTGTLTTGKFTLRKLETFNIDESEAASIISGMEEYSNHPIAKSLIQSLSTKNIKKVVFTSVIEERGIGMKAVDAGGNEYHLGSGHILNYEKGEKKDDSFNIYLKKNGSLIARLSIEDEIRPGATALIADLKAASIIPVLLSGDQHKRCEELASTLGIDKIFSEKLPHEKLEIIDNLKKEGKTGMVGDGINDAPALTTSDVGISMSSASQIAIQSSGVVLLNSDLKSIHLLLRIGKHTLITIKQNLFWAFFYNVIAIPVAAVGLLNPMVGALTMAFSDVIVIGNSIRLKTKSLR